MESPLDPADNFAPFRVGCRTCHASLWAGNEPPPTEGEDILAEHDCPGPPVEVIETVGTHHVDPMAPPVGPPPAPVAVTEDDDPQPRQLRTPTTGVYAPHQGGLPGRRDYVVATGEVGTSVMPPEAMVMPPPPDYPPPPAPPFDGPENSRHR